MSFITDNQTLEDLNIPGKYKSDSFFYLFNRVRSAGGERLLNDMFRQPLSNVATIHERVHMFRYFQDKNLAFPVNPGKLEKAETYLTSFSGTSYIASAIDLVYKYGVSRVYHNTRFEDIRTGLYATMEVLLAMAQFQDHLRGSPLGEWFERVAKVWDPANGWLRSYQKDGGLSFREMVQAHHDLLNVFREEITALLDLLHLLDVCLSVAGVAREKSLGFAEVLPGGPGTKQELYAEGLWHPAVGGAVRNTLHFNSTENMLFLTGANMAGKSTLMKAIGAAVYLAHIGFPVAAENMRLTLMDGLFTSINVPDNLNSGYSHFYAEVMRVKKIAEEVSNGKNLVVIFDELFKGTNVKDAFDATLAVGDAFAGYRNCFYIISTHITEVGTALMQARNNIHYGFMPTVLREGRLTYTYRMAEGVSGDRQGMMIIENEGICSMLEVLDAAGNPAVFHFQINDTDSR